MGGLGSGREKHSRRWKTTETICIDSRVLRTSSPGEGVHLCSQSWYRNRDLFAWIHMVVSPDQVRLEVAKGPKGLRPIHTLLVEWSRCRYGGQRAWFVCRECLKRTAKVYVGSQGTFACRTCCRLVYPSQYQDPATRALKKAEKVRRYLLPQSGASGSAFPQRPKGMHRKTYQRLISQFGEAMMKADDLEFHQLSRRCDQMASRLKQR